MIDPNTKTTSSLKNHLRKTFGQGINFDRSMYEFIISRSIDACAEHHAMLEEAKQKKMVASAHRHYAKIKNQYYRWRYAAQAMDTVLMRQEALRMEQREQEAEVADMRPVAFSWTNMVRLHDEPAETRLSVEEQLREIY